MLSSCMLSVGMHVSRALPAVVNMSLNLFSELWSCGFPFFCVFPFLFLTYFFLSFHRLWCISLFVCLCFFHPHYLSLSSTLSAASVFLPHISFSTSSLPELNLLLHVCFVFFFSSQLFDEWVGYVFSLTHTSSVWLFDRNLSPSAAPCAVLLP